MNKASCAGWGHIYITDDRLSNPWNERPNFWDDMVEAAYNPPADSGPCPDAPDSPLRIMVPFLPAANDDATGKERPQQKELLCFL